MQGSNMMVSDNQNSLNSKPEYRKTAQAKLIYIKIIKKSQYSKLKSFSQSLTYSDLAQNSYTRTNEMKGYHILIIVTFFQWTEVEKPHHYSLLSLSFWKSVITIIFKYSFPGGSEGKESACGVGDSGLILGLGRSLEKGMATHSSILAWRIPWAEEPGRLHSIGSQRFGHD